MRAWYFLLIGVALVAMLVIAVSLLRRRRTMPAAAIDATGVAPVTGLEAALDQVADRSGRSITASDDGAPGPIDRLRSSDDDTSPLLRRALDLVADDGSADDDPPG